MGHLWLMLPVNAEVTYTDQALIASQARVFRGFVTGIRDEQSNRYFCSSRNLKVKSGSGPGPSRC